MHIESIQTGAARKVSIHGRTLLTAIHKTPIEGAVQVRALGLQGDEQADPTVHGGLEKAVYAYPAEHYPFWLAQREAAGLGGIDDRLAPGVPDTETFPGDAQEVSLPRSGTVHHRVAHDDVLRRITSKLG